MENASRILVSLPHGKVPYERAAQILIEGGPAGIALLADHPERVGDLLLDELDMHEDNETLELCRRVGPSARRLQQVRGYDLVRWGLHTSTLGGLLNGLELHHWAGFARAYDPELTLGTSLQQARIMAPAMVLLEALPEPGGPSLLGVLLEGTLHSDIHLGDNALRGVWLAAVALEDDHLAGVLLVSRYVPQDILDLARDSSETVRSALVLSRQTTKDQLASFETDTAPEVQRALRARLTWSRGSRGVGRIVPQAS